jgi:hypothetical protein
MRSPQGTSGYGHHRDRPDPGIPALQALTIMGRGEDEATNDTGIPGWVVPETRGKFYTAHLIYQPKLRTSPKHINVNLLLTHFFNLYVRICTDISCSI